MAVERSYTKFGAMLTELEIAAADRLADAEALLVAGRYATSIAMGIYSLEIYLKVGVCKRLDLPALPKAFEIHDLESLLVLTGLSVAFDSAPQPVRTNWEKIVIDSGEINALRYQPGSLRSQAQARAFLSQLRDPNDGVIPWFLTQF